LCTNQSVAAIFPSSKFNEDYLFYNLDSRYNELRQLSTGDGGRGGLNLKIINSLYIPLPPLFEQKRIAEVLSTWDQAIQLTEQLIRQKELRKKWLMQNLLTGKMRLKGFSGVWKFVKFKDFYSESKLKVGSKKYEVLSVTKTGIVPQSEYFNKEIASSNTSNYLIVEKGDFVVSGLNFWMGSFDVLSNFDIGIVSPAYKVYKLKVGFEKTFFKFLSKSKLMLDAMIGASIVGASIVRRNFDKEILMEWSFKIPSIEEQTAIAEVLQTADKEIELLKAKTEQLKEQKKGLMQQLLTGRMRLNLITINK
jgi:type I restriction enzyme S subunit